jgi:hypothetical protein
MLSRLRIVLFDFHLVRLGALVLVGGVEVTGTCGRFQFDLFSHGVGS